MEEKFKEILSQYCTYAPDEIQGGMRFREDLGMSSLDFATLLGEIEDEFDMEFEDTAAVQVSTVAEAIAFLEEQA